MPKEDAQRVAAQIMQDKQGALDTLAREELGIDPTELGGNPWSAAATSAAVLGAVGMLTSLFNGRSWWYSAARQLIFGCLAAGVTYGIGAALGTSLS
jgi:VIT1/CCC1 family predicted Fe2+/Mn2+ transporter